MPVLDKLTTIVEWDVDTGVLERYDALVGQSEVSTVDLSRAISKTDTEISGINAAPLEILSESLENLSADFGDVPGETTEAADGVSLFGESVASVSIDLEKLAVESNMALKELVRLAGESQKASRELDEAGRAAARAAKEDKEAERRTKELEDGFASLGRSVIGTIGNLAKLGSIATGVLTGIGVLSSREIAINSRLAGSVGMTTESYLAWDGVLSQMGMSGEQVVDMIEETANKLGELQGLGKMSSAQDSLRMLGIEFANIKDLAPEEQFRTIMAAAKDLGDEKIARSAVDMIFGGEANKVLGHLRTLDGSLQDILDSYARYNFLTDEGVEGSSMLADMLKNVGTAGKTLSAEITGRLAKNLAPMVDLFFDWVAANRALIDQKIEGVVKDISDALRWIGWGVEKVIKLVESLGGAGRVIKEVAVAFGAWKLQSWVSQLSLLASKMTLSAGALTAMKTAATGLKSVGLAGLFGAAYLALEDLYYFLTGGKSAIGRFMDEQLPKAESAFLHFMGVIDDEMTKDQKEQITAGFRQGFLDGTEIAKNFFGGMVDSIGDVTSEIVKFFDGLFSYFPDTYDKMKALGESVLSFFGGIGDSISSFFSGVIDSIGARIDSLVLSAKEAFKSIPVLGSLVSDQPVSAPGLNLSGGVKSSFSSGIQGVPSGAVFAGAGNTSVNTTISSPITINAAAGMSESKVADMVVSKMKDAFRDVKTTGIRR